MTMNASQVERDYQLIKQQIWQKFADRMREWQESESLKAFPPLNPSDMNPDVIVIPKNGTLLFEARTLKAADWLRNRYGLGAGDSDEDTKILVHPNQQKTLTAELKAAGFAVAE